MQPIRLVRGFVTVGGWTMASRLLGFARDIMIAAFLGAGPTAQAFIVAFALPNMFRRFFAEGAFNMAFVPMFSKRHEAGEAAGEFARDAFSGLASILILFTLLGQLAMPWLVLAMASGFADDQRFDLAVTFGRIAFPYILMISLAALCSGVLNAVGRFTAAAAAPVLLNLLFIAAMLGADVLHWNVGMALAWTVPLAGVAQLALVWIAARRAGIALYPRWPRLTPDMRRLARIAAPAVLAGGVVQINLLVGRQVASYYEGAVAWLYNADRLYQLPLGVVAIAIGVVLLPDLSRRLKASDVAGSRASYSRAAEFALAMTLPAAVALVVIPMPLIQVLFERGRFTAADVPPTALAVAVYGAGLPAFVLQKVLQPLFFAREDTRRPFYYALAAMVVNAAIALGLAPAVGFIAAALGTTLAGWVMVWLLLAGARAMGPAASFDDRFRRRLPRILLASAGMGMCLFLAEMLLEPLWGMAGIKYLALLSLIGAGAVSYFALGVLLGAFRVSDFRAALRRG
ncbi:virulence factor MviN [Defluviimonas sp. 20V17]|uniref:Probable lipid II flippase MurJ n=1 Tax=Allgaiera indica TaxID=765699 RepID=A0AAN4UND0_9RHOB|nr:murein biosynthesis integral membrane protein MurJ [Allgaiera indica]KDB05696.1 virulence factor MviN [Defluviimonas sp. 20V17]GHD98950.1 putative lipid II flippase MurJ [Allgaiera indica]SDW02888.1 putative peptidoglycan lipid II flippase [Allgaiera indica]